MGKLGSTKPEDIGLDLKLGAARAAAGFLKSDPAFAGRETRAARLAEALLGLEEERSKIEAFKRELPISVLIVSDVIGFVKDELEQCRSERGEEFKFEEEKKFDNDFRDKMDWMSSTKLWSDNHENNNNNKNIQEKGDNLSLESKNKNGGGAFVPYKAPSSLSSSSKKEENPSRPIPSMADEHQYAINNIPSSKGVVRDPISSHESIGHLSLQTQHQQLSRKSRRCWSPQLHRRFVLALQQLGGAQVATPKQIRDLMKVEGLTNDEVKSHLQKYRLHNRRAPNSIASSVQRPVVVVGGLWSPHEQCTASPKTGSHSGSPQGPLQLSGSARADSFTAGDSCEDDMKSESSTRN